MQYESSDQNSIRYDTAEDLRELNPEVVAELPVAAKVPPLSIVELLSVHTASE